MIRPRATQLAARFATLLPLTVALLLSSCTWVKVSEAGAGVAIRAANEVSSCERVGVASVKTTAKVVLARDTRKVQSEVYAMAKNQAGTMNANVAVPIGQIVDGAQSFDVYRCP